VTSFQVLLLGCVLPAVLAAQGCTVVTSDDDDRVSTGSATEATNDTELTGSSEGSGDADPTSASGESTGDHDGDQTGSPEDSTGETGGGDEGGGVIDVVLSGCDVDLGGTVVVTYNGSLGVASVYDGGATLSGSFQFDLAGTGVYALSSQHRVDTGTVVNLVDVAQGTWTNLDADALSGGVDTIGGTLTVHTWDPASGVADLALDGVSLRNVSDANVCTIDGTIVTTKLYP
jgi:hypothetical protein